MLNKIILLAGVLIISSDAMAKQNTKVSKSLCLKIDAKIATAKKNMRVMYTKKKGQKLRAKLKALQKKKVYCKISKFPTSS
jgi:ethanolamine utilization protein EutA (predicted chaperonin)